MFTLSFEPVTHNRAKHKAELRLMEYYDDGDRQKGGNSS